jgi:hypothetical protein
LKIERRRFLQLTGAVAVGGIHSFALGQATGSWGHVQRDWAQRPMRWIQLAFVEDDPETYDLAFWSNYFKETHAEAACLSAGGIVAFYPTELPLHFRSPWLGKKDTFGDTAKVCRDLGMAVVARTDPHACHQDVYDAHPDWIMEDEHGQKRRHPSDPSLWLTCGLGPYNFEFMTSVHREIMQRYRPDGIFINRWSGFGMCFCSRCRGLFRAATGFELPVERKVGDPASIAYAAWREERLFELWGLWNKTVQSIETNSCCIVNAAGGAMAELDLTEVASRTPTMFADKQVRTKLEAAWAMGKTAKEYRAALGNRPVAGLFSISMEERYRWKDAGQSVPETMLWASDGIAQGARPWLAKFSAKINDSRWLPAVRELFSQHYAHESYFRNERSLADVAMVYSQQTARFYGQDAGMRVEDAASGFYQALIEARIPFDMVHDRMFDEETLKRYQILVLPNIAVLSDHQCDQLRTYVQGGGNLVATFETSLYKENGERRSDFGLASLFGASIDGPVQGPMKNSYLRFKQPLSGSAGAVLLEGLEGTPRIPNAGYQVAARPNGTLQDVPVEIIATYPDLPMEELFTRDTKGAGPGIYLTTHGAGRVVYLPGDLDRSFWEALNADQGRLLANTVRWAQQRPFPVELEGHGVFDIAIWRQKSSLTVPIVNLTNPMMMRGPIREVYPATNLTVRIRIPEDVKIGGIKLLSSGVAPRFERRAGVLSVFVAEVAILETIAIDLPS